MRFYINAIWDEDTKIFYSESDIVGLHIEAATIEEFKDVMEEFAPALVLENHVSAKDLARKSILEMIPSIFFNSPNVGSAAA